MKDLWSNETDHVCNLQNIASRNYKMWKGKTTCFVFLQRINVNYYRQLMRFTNYVANNWFNGSLWDAIDQENKEKRSSYLSIIRRMVYQAKKKFFPTPQIPFPCHRFIHHVTFRWLSVENLKPTILPPPDRPKHDTKRLYLSFALQLCCSSLSLRPLFVSLVVFNSLFFFSF